MKRHAILLVLSYCLLIPSVPVSARVLQVVAGNLQNWFDNYDLMSEGELKLVGTINGTDVKLLRKWASDGKTLDLKDCRIVAGGEPYYEDYTTEDDVIGSYMFGDKELKRLVLPQTLKKIGDYAISFCGDSLDFPPTLTWLGDHAFTNNFFKRLHLPASLVHIGNGALNGNISLSNVTLDEDNPEFVLEDGYLFSRDHTRLLSYFAPIDSRIESFTIRPEVTIIDDKAFNNHRSYNIILNERLEHIGDGAFRYALNNIAPHLPKLVIPNSVTYIGANAFDGCYIDSLIISDNVEDLQEWSFHGCFIYYIHLPAKLKYIREYAFANNSLENLVLPDGLETIEEHAFGQLRVSKLVIPSSVRNLAEKAFWNTYSDTIEIQAPLDSIPSACFYGCQMLKKLILPPTIKRIGGTAFYECYRLEDCKLPEGLEEIGVEALAGADDLKEWHIPASVRKIEFGAFFVPNYSAHNLYMYSKEPPAETDPKAFCEPMNWMSWNMAESVLYVPEGCIENYRQAPWCDFGTIKEFIPADIPSPQLNNKQFDERSFDLLGRPVSPNARGLRIVMTPDGTRKVLFNRATECR